MRLVLTLLLGLGVVSSSACTSTRTAEARVSTVALTVTGMKCPVECPAKVHAALVEVPGVDSASVDYGTGAVVVSGHGVERGALVAALQRAGFGVQP